MLSTSEFSIAITVAAMSFALCAITIHYMTDAAACPALTTAPPITTSPALLMPVSYTATSFEELMDVNLDEDEDEYEM